MSLNFLELIQKFSGQTVEDLAIFAESIEYKPALTSFDLREAIEKSGTDKELGLCFSFVTTLGGANFTKIRERAPEWTNLLLSLDQYYSRWSTFKNKRIGRGKLSAAFPEAELRAAFIVHEDRPADFSQRFLLYHFISDIWTDNLGHPIPKGEDHFVKASNKFVHTISRGKFKEDDPDRSNILRAIYADPKAKSIKA